MRSEPGEPIIITKLLEHFAQNNHYKDGYLAGIEHVGDMRMRRDRQ